MELFDYQKKAIKLVKEKKKIYLALAPGLGKTLTSLVAGLEAHDNNLVVAEKNEIENSENFRKEVETYFEFEARYYSLRKDKLSDITDKHSYKVVGGQMKVQKKVVAGVNPEKLLKLPTAEVVERFKVLIVDEATVAKSANSARFKAIYEIAKQVEYVILLSGTPMMNGAAELYAPLLLLGHRIAGDGTDLDKYDLSTYDDDLMTYRKAFEIVFANAARIRLRWNGLRYNKYRDSIWIAKDTRYVRELRYLIQDRFHIVRKQDTKGIFKKKVRRMEYVQIHEAWEREYAQAWNDYIATLSKRFGELTEKQFKKKLENITELQKLIEKSQIAQINSKWLARQIVTDIKAGKYGDKRIVVFSDYVETDELLVDLLTQEGIGFRTFEESNLWKKGKEQVLLGRIRAHGKGTNAPEASVVLFTGMSYVPNENVQAENRIDRPEQKNDMEIVYYSAVRGEEDEAVCERIRKINKDKADKIEEFMRPLTPEEIAEMPARLEKLRKLFPIECAKLGI